MASVYQACALPASLTSLLSFLTDEFKCPIKEEVALTSGEWEVLSRHGSKVPHCPQPSSRPGMYLLASAFSCSFSSPPPIPQGPQDMNTCLSREVHMGRPGSLMLPRTHPAVHCVSVLGGSPAATHFFLGPSHMVADTSPKQRIRVKDILVCFMYF